MKLSQLVNAFPAMRALGETKLPAKIGFRVAKALTLARSEITLYEASRTTLAQGLGTLSEDGSHFKFEGDNGVEFTAQHKALLDEEITTIFPSITADEIGDAVIEPSHLIALDGVLIC